MRIGNREIIDGKREFKPQDLTLNPRSPLDRIISPSALPSQGGGPAEGGPSDPVVATSHRVSWCFSDILNKRRCF